MEEFVNKIQEEIGRFDKEHLRKIQGEMFRCSAKCCDDESLSQDQMQRCLDRCAQPAMKADNYMKEQMQDLEDRFKRCAMACADKVRDKSSGDVVRQRAEMEECVTKCGSEMVNLMPTYTKRMREWFKKGTYLQ